MSDKIKLWCWVQNDEFDKDRLLQVQMTSSDTISVLKKAIISLLSENIPLKHMKLWKFEQPIANLNNASVRLIELEKCLPLISTKSISEFWKIEPPNDILSVIISRSTRTMSASSRKTDLSLSPPLWLVDLHSKLWGKRHLLPEIFRAATLTKTDFIELQHQLHSHDPERNSDSSVLQNAIAIKADFLRSRSFADSTASAHFDATPNGNLVPKLVFDTTHDVTPPISDDDEDTTAMDAASEHVGVMDVDPNPDLNSRSYIENDAIYLSTGNSAMFPCTIRYMDLTILGLTHFTRTPQLILLQNEWGNMVDIFNKREKGIGGSAIFTGQPGIGKTCLLYYILILCLIRAQRLVFQDMGGEVFIIHDEVRCRSGRVDIQGDDILALVDADNEKCTPHRYLLDVSNLRVLLTSSPRTKNDRRWLTQSVHDERALFVMEPWSQEEFLVASLFLANIDLPLKRLQAVIRICGHNPRRCLDAAVSPAEASQNIIAAINECNNLREVISQAHSGQQIHRAFEIYPALPSRQLDICLIRPISDWVFSHIIAELDRQGADAAYRLYQTLEGTPAGASLAGRLFENKVHKFFRSITEFRRFTIFSLEKPSIKFDIEFSSGTRYCNFGATQHFSGQLASAVNDGKSCYLVPVSPVFPTFDSFLYQHGMSRAGYQSLVGLQITGGKEHPISVKGLAETQKSLKPKIPVLNDLRPIPTKKWIILFVFPETMMASFQMQQFTDSEKCAHWAEKTTQYVLGLPVQEVLRS